ncbi:hypothetical protein DP115_21950 [Brasilonema octagenarum UFV-OR1]|uniref:Uncharacterized protein n=1 Tax=Brasilonema octagenarum UFV-OR1 TaxID=417115 RepID=A0ABX1ME01_9CYAN|nr:hypothetical protein [Brasilonema octagenarum UFV-OR1]
MLLPLAQAFSLKLPSPLHLWGCVVKGWSKNKQFYIQPIVLWENQLIISQIIRFFLTQNQSFLMFTNKAGSQVAICRYAERQAIARVTPRGLRNNSLLFYLSRQNFNCCSTGSWIARVCIKSNT